MDYIYDVTPPAWPSQHHWCKVALNVELTPPQCRAARALLNWSQADLEAAAAVAKKTIADFEREARAPYPRTLAAIRSVLEAAGVEFIAENGGGAGVRLRKPGVP
jgi:DNA-binding XRE family transcriptional regulator